jgi:nucleoside-diphosphate-sugar epimerase
MHWDEIRGSDPVNSDSMSEVIKRHRPDAVLHLAWRGLGGPSYELGAQHSTSLEEARGALEACCAQETWCLLVGSALDNPSASDGSSETPYSRAKRSLFRDSEDALSAGHATWLRPQYVVSIADRRPRLMERFLEAATPSDLVVSEPERALDFIEVRDVAHGMAAALSVGMRGVVDLGYGRAHSIRALLEAVDESRVRHLLGEEIARCQQRSQPPLVPANLRKAGWFPRFTAMLFGVSTEDVV